MSSLVVEVKSYIHQAKQNAENKASNNSKKHRNQKLATLTPKVTKTKAMVPILYTGKSNISEKKTFEKRKKGRGEINFLVQLARN